MSYEIIYDKCFIKAGENLYCPIILMGSNNCYEVERNRRSRSWCNIRNSFDGKLLVTKEDIEKYLNVEHERIIESNKQTLTQYPDWQVYSDDNYGYFSGIAMYGKGTSRTTWNQYKSVWTNGMKQALTIEQLVEGNISVNLHAYVWDAKKFKEETGKDVLQVYVKTTAQLIDEVKNFEDYYKNTNATIYITFEVYDEKRIKKLRTKIFSLAKEKKQKVAKTINEFWVLKNSYGYFIKLTKYGFKYTYEKDSYICKRLLSEKQAIALTKKVNERMFSVPEKIFTPCKVEKELTIYV